jgi:hypothetical protein
MEGLTMRNYQKYGFEVLETENFRAFCNVYNNRSGFVHECRLESKKTGEQTTAKAQYYNRTWESYHFESVILKACESLPKKEREQAKKEFENYGQEKNKELDQKFENFKENFNSLTDKQKEIFKNVTVQNEDQFNQICGITAMLSLFNK